MARRSFYRDQELPDIPLEWEDDDGQLIDFSTGWTFTWQIGRDGQLFINKTTGITGSATSPNLLLAFTAGEFAGLPAGIYQLIIYARRTSDGKDAVFPEDITIEIKDGFTDAGVLVPLAGGTIDQLSDVTITSAATGQIIYYDGTVWKNGYSGFADGQRITLGTTVETSGSWDNELIRLQSLTISAKATLAYLDMNADTQAWIQWHPYLHHYRTYSTVAANVDTTNNRIANASLTTVSGVSEWRTVEYAALTTTGTAPGGLTAGSSYYVRTSGGFVTFHNSAADAAAGTNTIDLTTQGTGTHTLTPDLDYNNNKHQHLSIELLDALGAVQTRMSFPTGFNWAQIATFQSDFNICDGGKLKILGEQGANKQLVFGNTPNDNLVHDGLNHRWFNRQNTDAESGGNAGSNLQWVRASDTGTALDVVLHLHRATGFVGVAGNTNPGVALDIGGVGTTAARVGRAATTQFASFVLGNAGSDQFSFQLRQNLTDAYIRDNVNSRNLAIFRQAGQFAVPNGFEIARREISDAAVTVSASSDNVIAFLTLTASRTVTLPSAATVGQVFTIVDESGSASGGTPIVLSPATGTINGAASFSITTARQAVTVQRTAAGYTIIGKG